MGVSPLTYRGAPWGQVWPPSRWDPGFQRCHWSSSLLSSSLLGSPLRCLHSRAGSLPSATCERFRLMSHQLSHLHKMASGPRVTGAAGAPEPDTKAGGHRAVGRGADASSWTLRGCPAKQRIESKRRGLPGAGAPQTPQMSVTSGPISEPLAISPQFIFSTQCGEI